MPSSKIAFVFPGQGSQKVGMGKSLYDASEAAKAVWDKADELLGFSLTKLAFEGPEEELKATQNAQLALFTSEVACLKALEDRGIRPDACAGHSVGEYAALVASGALNFEQGLALVRVRGQAMAKAGQASPGTMAAIIGLAVDGLEEILKTASEKGTVVIANYNSPEQIVISGSNEGVQAASDAAAEAGAKRVVPLVVSGAFHSPLMQQASDELGAALADSDIKDPAIPVVLNVTADFAENADRIREMLQKQVVSQVRWHESAEKLAASGYTTFLEAGPGKVLTGLARRMHSSPDTLSVDEASDLDAAVQGLAS